MKTKSFVENKFLLVAGAFVLTALFVLREYLYDGVVTHHLLANEDLPGISNWWGLLTIPLLTWIVSTLLKRRRRIKKQSLQNLEENDKRVLKRFFTALIFGIAVSIFWELNLENVLQYFILLPILIAFFKPVHFPEFLLGFAIGMIYSFGGILPIIIGLVLLIICFSIHMLIQLIKTAASSKTKNSN